MMDKIHEKGTYFDLEFGIGDISALRTNLVIRISWFSEGSPHLCDFFQSLPKEIKMNTFPGKSNETNKRMVFSYKQDWRR